MSFIAALKKIKKSFDSYQPLIEIFIYRENILNNLRQFQTALPNMQFAPVLKSNAYGHGLVEVAKILDDKKLPFFMIDSLFEARSLRHEAIKTPILVLGYTAAENIISQNLKNISFGITSLDQLKILDKKIKHRANFHLKIDTGMHRQGIMPKELGEAVDIIKNNSKIKLEGICSHLADTDGEDDVFSDQQIALWNKTITDVEARLGTVKFKHLANTAGAAFAKKINANVSRLGIGLYGFNSPSDAKPDLKPFPAQLQPALEMRSVVSSVRLLAAGERIGYNGTFIAPRAITAATVPAGYAEGIDRRLSNIGAMMIGRKVCPILGRVSMNITSIDVTNVPDAHLGQKVTLISKNPQDPNSIINIAGLCGTIPYEILVHLKSQLKRTVV